MSESLADAMRRVLTDLDVDGMIRLWPRAFPHLPAARNRDDVLKTLHAARTSTRSIPLQQRRYSHAWLTERGLPSMLPDFLRPVREQMRPRVADAVGIAVNCAVPEVKSAIHGVMRDAVLDAYADGRTDPVFVKGRMMDARARERKALGLAINERATA